MVKNFKMFENENIVKSNQYILGVPSGEIIEINSKILLKLIDENLINYHDVYMCYYFKDKYYKNVKRIISEFNDTEIDKYQKDYIEFNLDKFEIKNYIINDDLSVDVRGDVDISGRNLIKIPIKFNIIDGDFDCSNNKLTNLVNSPRTINGIFNCSKNNIYTLIGGPNFIKMAYDCSDNLLEELDGYPIICPNIFDCSNNQINTLKHLPKILDVVFFDVSYNRLKNLTGPVKTKNFDCSNNNITTLVNGITECDGTFNCNYNKLYNLLGAPKAKILIYERGNNYK